MASVLACRAALSSSACSRVSAVAGLRELPGATIVTGGLVALVTGLSQAPAWGWTATTTLALLATGVAPVALRAGQPPLQRHHRAAPLGRGLCGPGYRRRMTRAVSSVGPPGGSRSASRASARVSGSAA